MADDDLVRRVAPRCAISRSKQQLLELAVKWQLSSYSWLHHWPGCTRPLSSTKLACLHPATPLLLERPSSRLRLSQVPQLSALLLYRRYSLSPPDALVLGHDLGILEGWSTASLHPAAAGSAHGGGRLGGSVHLVVAPGRRHCTLSWWAASSASWRVSPPRRSTRLPPPPMSP
jgi:hypothetical protein